MEKVFGSGAAISDGSRLVPRFFVVGSGKQKENPTTVGSGKKLEKSNKENRRIAALTRRGGVEKTLFMRWTGDVYCTSPLSIVLRMIALPFGTVVVVVFLENPKSESIPLRRKDQH